MQICRELVDINSDTRGILRVKLDVLEWDQKVVDATVNKLIETRKAIGGGAGLAAPQIGMPLPIFIYTPDRTDENLRAVINPTIKPVGEEQIQGEEACFSVPLHIVTLPRWVRIEVRYQNTNGHWVEEELTGFAAKVFQHEYAHLQGQLIVDHAEAKIQRFSTVDEFEKHIEMVKRQDAKRY